MEQKTLGQVAYETRYFGLWDVLTTPTQCEYEKMADAVIQAHEARRWKAIESAPKDGTEVDLRSRNGRWPACKWDDKRQAWVHWWIGGFDVMAWVELGEHVTHWTPIPAPPKEAEHGR